MLSLYEMNAVEPMLLSLGKAKLQASLHINVCDLYVRSPPGSVWKEF